MAQVIVIGGGLSGMSAAHTVLEHGANVVLIDKSPFCGGNSTKATSGINAAGSRAQRNLNIPDTPEIFENDTTVSAAEGARPDLIKVLTHQSGPAVDWLMDAFNLDLSVIARLAAHTHPRTHRGLETFPGMMITYGLMERLDEIAEETPDRARVITKAEVTELIKDGENIVGVIYTKGGQTFKEYGPVVIASGGFGADFSDDSLLSSVEKEWDQLEAWQGTSRAGQQSGGKKMKSPPLRDLPTTNGPHCTGDGVKMAIGAGAGTFDMHCVQIHPTGLVDPENPDAKVKFLAAEALRGCGGILLDKDGNRFADELGKRDYVTGRMWLQNNGPYRLCLNTAAQKQIEWHCDHYSSRGLMKPYTGAELAKEVNSTPEKLQGVFDVYNKAAKNPGTDAWGKKYFNAVPAMVDDNYMVAVVTPVVHYCMGGVAGNKHAEVIRPDETPIPGLFVCGEALGGVHGTNRLGGSSLLDCVVYGRVAGKTASKFLTSQLIKNGGAGGAIAGGAGAPTVNVKVAPGSKSVSLDISWGESSGAAATADAPAAASGGSFGAGESDENQDFYSSDADKVTKKKTENVVYTAAEVAKHTTDDDCWVIVEGNVYDVSDFLEDHPGGKKAIMIYAGKDATKEFMMMHKPEILTKYASEFKLGPVAPSSNL